MLVASEMVLEQMLCNVVLIEYYYTQKDSNTPSTLFSWKLYFIIN